MLPWMESFNPYFAFWTIAVGAASSIACAILGCYLVLRRLSLIGDAISHAVLPGLVLAFLFTGTRNPVPMIIGAMILGVLTAFLTQSLHRMGRMPTDTSMGVVFTSLFALGVILITHYAEDIDLDPGCVLYGLIEFVPLDTIPFAGPLGVIEIPRAFLVMSGALLLVIVFVGVLWKELKICAFDPALATSMGISAGLIHYALMAMVATVTVTSFEAVGSILVIAMLIAPGAAAHLLTDKLGRMIVIASIIAFISSVVGYFGGLIWNTSVAGMIAVAAGAQFALAAILSPRYGVLGRAAHNLAVGLRIMREDALATLWRENEAGGAPALAREDLRDRVGGGFLAEVALRLLVRSPFVVAQPGGSLALTEAGLGEAARLIRAHRLWETFLGTELERSPDRVHESAHRVEHFLEPELTDRLEQSLDQPTADPHGSPIPESRSSG